MHSEKRKNLRRTLGVLLSTALTMGFVTALNFTATASTPAPITRTVPAGGLNFSTSTVMDRAVGDTVTYPNIDGAGTMAIVELAGVVNLHTERTGTEWHLDWADWHEQYSDTVHRYQVAWRLNYEDRKEPWNYVGLSGVPASTLAAVTDPLSNTYDNFRLTNVSETVLRDLLDFTVFYQTGPSASWQAINFTESDDEPNLDKTSSNTGSPFVCEDGDGVHACHQEVEMVDRLEGLDIKRITSTLVDGFIRLELNRDSSSSNDGEAAARVRVSFFDSDGITPVIFSNLDMSIFDLDNEQFLEIAGVSLGQIDSGSNISETTARSSSGTWRTAASDTIWRVLAKDDSTDNDNGVGDAQFTDPANTSYTAGKVTVSYSSVSVIEFEVGLNSSGGSFEVDMGGRVANYVEQNSGSGSSGGAGIGAAAPAVTLISPLAIVNVPSSRNVSLFGTNFDKVTEVYVGGRKLKILKQTATQIDIRLPRGLSGLVDLELKSTLNNVLSPKHFNYGGVAASGTRKATIIVGGFDHNSRKLTARMKARIDRWLDRNSDLSTLTCTGFTSLPRRTTDVELSTNRGTTACAYAKSQRPEVTTSVSQGVEDPRPGSNVRRVRLVLTP
jgi:hypothetical protein